MQLAEAVRTVLDHPLPFEDADGGVALARGMGASTGRFVERQGMTPDRAISLMWFAQAIVWGRDADEVRRMARHHAFYDGFLSSLNPKLRWRVRSSLGRSLRRLRQEGGAS